MRVIPAIDIRDGRCVRLRQGDPDHETVYHQSPVEQARIFAAQGATLIHVVDLDGAFQGRPVNSELVAGIARSSQAAIEIGGGIRSSADIERYRSAGIGRIIVGSMMLNDDFQLVAREFGDSLIAGIDARDGKVATHGWKNESQMSDEDLIAHIASLGIKEVIYTDIAVDGMLQGPSLEPLIRLLEKFPQVRFCASGGVSCVDDVIQLARLPYSNLVGCITGKAVYDGRIDLVEAIRAASGAR